jgi:sugar phosphate isomerase/epimerase
MADTSVFILAPDFPALDGYGMLSGAYSESLPIAKQLGYDGVEIIMGDPDQFDASAFKALLEEHNLRISAINSGGIEYMFKASLVNADPGKMDLALAHLKSYIRQCQKLGCIQQVGVARGFAVPGRSMRWFKDCLVDVLKEAAAYAEQLDVGMVFEYTNRFEINTINTAIEAREIVDRVANSSVGMLIDTYHSYLEDPDVYQNIRDLKDYVRHFHLHDSNGGGALIGGGENDFERIMEVCGEIGYHNWFSDGLRTLTYSNEQVRQSTCGLRQLYNKYRV